jgi:hypothetical protein
MSSSAPVGLRLHIPSNIPLSECHPENGWAVGDDERDYGAGLSGFLLNDSHFDWKKNAWCMAVVPAVRLN